MTTISLEANVKNLVTSAGLSLASSGNTVTLSLNNSGLAQILSQILQSNSSVTVNYSATTNTITFTSTANVTQSQLAALLAQTLQNTGTVNVNYNSADGTVALNVIAAPTPLIITNQSQFNSNGEIAIGLNQDVFIVATNTEDWNVTQSCNLLFPIPGSGQVSRHLVFVHYELPPTSNISFNTVNLTAGYDLKDYSGRVLTVIGAGGMLSLHGYGSSGQLAN